MTIIGEVLSMSWLQAVLLGLLQGLTEFLPVSSTAHMAIVPQLFHQPDPGAAFSAIVQLGPIFAVIVYFRSDLVRYIRGILRTKWIGNVLPGDPDARLGWYTLLGSLPILILGPLLEKLIDKPFRYLTVIGTSMIVLALLLIWAERVGKRTVPLAKMNLAQALIVGFAQCLGLVPGASRSGSTITAGLFVGLDRESAARFSFLLGIPAITAAGLYKLYKVLKHSHLGGEVGPYLLAAVVAGLFAYAVIRWFMGYMRNHNTGIFILYRIIAGITILALVYFHVLPNSAPQQEEPGRTSPAVAAVSAHPLLTAVRRPFVTP